VEEDRYLTHIVRGARGCDDCWWYLGAVSLALCSFQVCKACGKGFYGLRLFDLKLGNSFGVVVVGIHLGLHLIGDSNFAHVFDSW
jgi:hypothetical protein